MAVGDPSVTAVVLNWNDYESTHRCVESLLALSYPDLDVVVVDNGSTDGSADRLESELEEPAVVRNDENLGFSGGMNAGIRRAVDAGTSYVWVLNNDVVVPEGARLDRLVDRLAGDSSIGVLSPKVMEFPETDEAWFVQGLVDWDSGNSIHRSTVVDESMRDGDLVYDDFVPFCAALFPVEVFEMVGYLPESYFIYREDVEFCGRLSDAGYDVATDTGVEVYHEGSNSAGGGMGATITYYTARNRWVLRHRMADRVERGAFLADYSRWSARKLLEVTQAREPRSVWAWLRGTVDGLRGRVGRGPYP